MNSRISFFVVGLFLIMLGLLMLVPAMYTLLSGSPATGDFFQSATWTVLAGMVLVITARPAAFRLDPRQVFVLTTLNWVVLSLFGALPFVLISHLSFTDAFFETMSGITTTGSTVVTSLDQMDKGILLWRSLLQWLGGVGFIVLGVAVLPFLRVGGMRLFQSESSDWSDKCLPRSGSIAKRIVLIYILLTLLCMVGYLLGGMPLFEAVNHAMTTLSTGGYSTSDASMGHFSSPFILWNGTLFMLLGGLPFVLFVKCLKGLPGELFKDTQVRAFIGFMVAVWLLLSTWLTAHSDVSFFRNLTLVAFNTTSVVTTTGFAATDYTAWSGLSTTVFFLLMAIGGCSGSTAGGVKIFRFQIGFRLLYIHLTQMSHPRAFLVHRYNGQEITNDILRSLIAFCFFYGLLIAMMTIILSAQGLDLLTSLSGTITAVSNVGPGIGPEIGPSGNFLALPDSSKWILSFGMLMGRLEIITVLVLFTPSFWRN